MPFVPGEYRPGPARFVSQNANVGCLNINLQTINGYSYPRGDTGGESLAETLAIGNTTDGQSIDGAIYRLNLDDVGVAFYGISPFASPATPGTAGEDLFLIAQDGNAANGAPVTIQGGSSGSAGDGGFVYLQGGSSNGGGAFSTAGQIVILGGQGAGTATGGDIQLAAGDTLAGNLDGGGILLLGGKSSGVGSHAGNVEMRGGECGSVAAPPDPTSLPGNVKFFAGYNPGGTLVTPAVNNGGEVGIAPNPAQAPADFCGSHFVVEQQTEPVCSGGSGGFASVTGHNSDTCGIFTCADTSTPIVVTFTQPYQTAPVVVVSHYGEHPGTHDVHVDSVAPDHFDVHGSSMIGFTYIVIGQRFNDS